MKKQIHKKIHIAVVGATGVVGREFLNILVNRFKKNTFTITGFASKKSSGKKIKIKSVVVSVKELKSETDFNEFDFVFFTAGGEISKKFIPNALKSKAWIVDNSSYFRMRSGIPLVIPEINGNEIFKSKQKLIANPNCTTAQMVLVLKPILDNFGLKRVILSSYQAVSGKGQEALKEFTDQIKWFAMNQKIKKPKIFKVPIAFNCIPHIDVFHEDGFTGEEVKVMNETRKILNEPRLKVTASCVRVPVMNGHSETVVIETKKSISPNQARVVLSNAKGVKVLDNPKKAEYPVATLVSGKDDVYVGRIRNDPSLTRSGKGLMLWIVGDNLRKGAALNAVQIFEFIIRNKK